jgi:hypothetical protein
MKTVQSYAQFHVNETARAARAAHALMMHPDSYGSTLYVYYRSMRIEAFIGDPPTGEGWALAWPECVPGNLTADQLVQWFAARTGRVPYLTEG